MTDQHPAYELGRGEFFIVFAQVEGKIHVSRWRGYDLESTEAVDVFVGRATWRRLVRDGYVKVRTFSVSALFLGLDPDHVSADARAAAWKSLKIAG